MLKKSTRVICDSDNPDYRPPLTLSPLAFEDITGESAYNLTPTGRAEIVAADTVAITGLLKQRLDEFRAARRAREQARGKELLKAMEVEDKAALLLAWTLDQDTDKA
jgi:ABC-type amino acid transport substrate-binding protein